MPKFINILHEDERNVFIDIYDAQKELCDELKDKMEHGEECTDHLQNFYAIREETIAMEKLIFQEISDVLRRAKNGSSRLFIVWKLYKS